LLPLNRFHIYAIGTQECGQSIATSVVLSSSKVAWEGAARKALGSRYDVLASHTLQAAHLIVFVHKALIPFLSDLRSAAVPCGLLRNSLGNKGGIGIAFRVLDTRFLFVSAHLAAGQRSAKLRHADYHRIAHGLMKRLGGQRKSGDDDDSEHSDDDMEEGDDVEDATPEERMEQQPLLQSFDHVVFCGDLNFRIDGSRGLIDLLLHNNMHRILLANDQLIRAREAEEAFAGFAEGPLNFHPTYKLDKGSNTYDSGHKARVPAWTDRVLFKAGAGVRVLSYHSVPELNQSDHRPVAATLHMPLVAQSANGQTGDNAISRADLKRMVEVKVSPRRRRLARCTVS
jgi:phosphatidylinositol-bisphosphatase